MTDYLSEEAQSQLWAKQAENNKQSLMLAQEQGRYISELQAQWVVLYAVLTDLIGSQVDPVAYHKRLSERVLANRPDISENGQPSGLKNALKELLMILDPKRTKRQRP